MSWLGLVDSQAALVGGVADEAELVVGEGQVELGLVHPLVVVGEAASEILVHGHADREGGELEFILGLKIG